MVKEEFAKIYGEENWKDNKNVLQAALGKGFEAGIRLAEENGMPAKRVRLLTIVRVFFSWFLIFNQPLVFYGQAAD